MTFVVTDSDRAAIRRAAKACGKTVSGFLRSISGIHDPAARFRDALADRPLTQACRDFIAGAVTKAENIDLLLQDDEAMDNFIQGAAANFEDALETVRELEAESLDMSKCKNNPLLSEDLDAECLPVETYETPVQEPGEDMGKMENNPLLDADIESGYFD